MELTNEEKKTNVLEFFLRTTMHSVRGTSASGGGMGAEFYRNEGWGRGDVDSP